MLRIINAEDQISADTVSEMKGASSNEYYRCTCEEGSERRENEGRCVCHNNDDFVVHDIKVIEGEKGLFIAMPSRKASDGEYRDIAHPINSATREQIQTIILDKYQEVMAEEAENEVLMEAAE